MNGMRPGSPVEILLIEDDPGDVLLTRRALAESKVSNVIHVMQDGVQALAFLRQQPPHEEAARPDLVLLDLNLPRKGGLEVLAEVKADPELRQIPVVVLTTSSADEDVIRSYDLHANAYIQKPVDLSRFLSVVHAVDEFFVGVVRLPPR
jgi:two-component system, chemotaxis family, response regulator Rcp1